MNNIDAWVFAGFLTWLLIRSAQQDKLDATNSGRDLIAEDFSRLGGLGA